MAEKPATVNLSRPDNHLDRAGDVGAAVDGAYHGLAEVTRDPGLTKALRGLGGPVGVAGDIVQRSVDPEGFTARDGAAITGGAAIGYSVQSILGAGAAIVPIPLAKFGLGAASAVAGWFASGKIDEALFEVGPEPGEPDWPGSEENWRQGSFAEIEGWIAPNPAPSPQPSTPVRPSLPSGVYPDAILRVTQPPAPSPVSPPPSSGGSANGGSRNNGGGEDDGQGLHQRGTGQQASRGSNPPPQPPATLQDGSPGGRQNRDPQGRSHDDPRFTGAQPIILDLDGDGIEVSLWGDASFDYDGDGRLTAAEGSWTSMKVWQDLDQDGDVDAGELRDRCLTAIPAVRTRCRSVLRWRDVTLPARHAA